ncbi:MAG: endonuclease/exonuclease/phosphatase family protein [Candidatus Campbellbacteria bacterium]|nr:endonuclease/exonuclease/phosphatase family protein [Candidatus Campbellbacteria bacterium]
MFRYLLIVILLFFLWFFWASGDALKEGEVVAHKKEFEVAKEGDVFNIVTYNVGYFSGFANEGLAVDKSVGFIEEKRTPDIIIEETKEILKDFEIDILATQEIDRDSKRSQDIDQVDEVADALSSPYSAFAVNWNKNFIPYPITKPSRWFGRTISGQAIFSKFKIVNHKSIKLTRPKQLPLRDSFYFDRLAQVVELDVGRSYPLFVINIHLDAFSADGAIVQSKEVLEIYREYKDKGAVILLGDFNNDIRDDKGNTTLDAFFDSDEIVITKKIFEEDDFTYPSSNAKIRIDHILYDPDELSLINERTLKEVGNGSDHLPVIATFSFIDEI